MASKGKKALVHTEESSKVELIRRFKANPLLFTGTILVLVIVIVAFVLVPAFGPQQGGSVDLTFGYYDKIPISYVPGNYFAQYYEMLSYYRRNTGDMNYNQFSDYQLWQDAYQAAVLQTAVLQEMKKSGYTAPSKKVDREVALLYQENGRFSQTLYERESSNSRLARWRQTQERIAVEHFYSDINGLLVPEQAASFIGKMASLERSFDMVSFPVNNYPDTELAAYGEENPDLFRQIHLSKITVSSSEREARQILSSIIDGTTTFEDAARTHSKDDYAERGGDMGVKLAHELVFEITDEAEREKVINLPRGEYSDVIKLDSEWAFFRSEEEVKPMDISDAASIDRIRSYIQTFERGRMENWAFQQADDFIAIAEKTNFDEAAYQTDLSKQSFGPIPINYGNVDLFNTLSSSAVQELSGSAYDENFWRIAFSTPVNTLSQPLVQGSNVLVLLPVSETEAEESTVESIQSTYSSYWLAYTFEQSLRSYFINSDKMDDRFMETFLRYLMPQYN